jgi:CheY-like chemotaxis protein
MNNWGMVVSLTPSGAEALALINEQTRFDIVIIDMQLTGMSGLMLAKELRKQVAELPIVMTSTLGVPMYAVGDNRHLHDLPIMVSPTRGANDQREAVRQLGVRSIIFKPIKPSVLRATLLEHLDKTVTPEAVGAGEDAFEASEGIDSDLGRRHPLRILLAEDNYTNQKVALRMLKRLGYEADVALNGLEAVKALHERQYDAILMDIQMPEMDGLEATRHIRMEFPASEQPYIVAMTAATIQLDREKCLAVGMDDFVAKPARIEDLADALKRCLPLSATTH